MTGSLAEGALQFLFWICWKSMRKQVWNGSMEYETVIRLRTNGLDIFLLSIRMGRDSYIRKVGVLKQRAERTRPGNKRLDHRSSDGEVRPFFFLFVFIPSRNMDGSWKSPTVSNILILLPWHLVYIWTHKSLPICSCFSVNRTALFLDARGCVVRSRSSFRRANRDCGGTAGQPTPGC